MLHKTIILTFSTTAVLGASADKVAAGENASGYMQRYLDDMQVYFEGNGDKTVKYDPIYFKKLETCMAKFDDTILMKS